MKLQSVGKMLVAGDLIEVPHPFIREAYTTRDCDGEQELIGWRPGIRNEPVPPDDAEIVADGVGAQILTVLGKYRAGKFPERIFYTRRWRDPDGREFGKGKLHIRTVGAFTSLARGYAHPYRLSGECRVVAMPRIKIEHVSLLKHS